MKTLKFILLEPRIVLDAALTGGLFPEINASNDSALQANRLNFEKILEQEMKKNLNSNNDKDDFPPCCFDI